MAALRLPQPPGGGLGAYLAQLNQALIRAFLPVVTQDDAVPQIILLAPNGTHYAVKVDNAGTLTTTVV